MTESLFVTRARNQSTCYIQRKIQWHSVKESCSNHYDHWKQYIRACNEVRGNRCFPLIKIVHYKFLLRNGPGCIPNSSQDWESWSSKVRFIRGGTQAPGYQFVKIGMTSWIMCFVTWTLFHSLSLSFLNLWKIVFNETTLKAETTD